MLAQGIHCATTQPGDPVKRLAWMDRSPADFKALRMRFGIDLTTDHTLEEVGTQFDVTRERIRDCDVREAPEDPRALLVPEPMRRPRAAHCVLSVMAQPVGCE